MIWTAALLGDFERSIADLFNSGQIRAPVHLSGGNEAELIKIFERVGPDDWVCGSWRMHYQCLLKGVPEDELRAEILAGRSIALCFPKYKIISSAIVGGILPIATGIAMGIKRSGSHERVWCFLGDMTARTGMAFECVEYASGHALPITFIEENNGLSVCTPSIDVWENDLRGYGMSAVHRACDLGCGDCYDYDLPWPHAGAGTRVQF